MEERAKLLSELERYKELVKSIRDSVPNSPDHFSKALSSFIGSRGNGNMKNFEKKPPTPAIPSFSFTSYLSQDNPEHNERSNGSNSNSNGNVYPQNPHHSNGNSHHNNIYNTPTPMNGNTKEKDKDKDKDKDKEKYNGRTIKSPREITISIAQQPITKESNYPHHYLRPKHQKIKEAKSSHSNGSSNTGATSSNSNGNSSNNSNNSNSNSNGNISKAYAPGNTTIILVKEPTPLGSAIPILIEQGNYRSVYRSIYYTLLYPSLNGFPYR